MFKPLRKLGYLASLAVLAFFTPAAVQAAPHSVTYLLPAPPNSPAFAPWILAKAEGYYAAHNLKVKFLVAKGGVDVAKQIGAGNAMVGGAIGDTPIIVRANGIPVKAVAVLGAGGITLIGSRAGAHIHNVKQLKGKTVTVMSYSDTTYYALLASLKMAGLSRDQVNIEAAGPAGVWQLFSSKRSDAMAGVPDWFVDAENAGIKVNFMPKSQVFESMAQAILASDSAIKNHPKIVQGVVTATLHGMRDIINNPKAAAAAFAKAVPAYRGKEATLVRIFKLYINRVYEHQKVLGHINAKRLAKVSKFYSNAGIASQSVPVKELYTNRFVNVASKLAQN